METPKDLYNLLTRLEYLGSAKEGMIPYTKTRKYYAYGIVNSLWRRIYGESRDVTIDYIKETNRIFIEISGKYSDTEHENILMEAIENSISGIQEIVTTYNDSDLKSQINPIITYLQKSVEMWKDKNRKTPPIPIPSIKQIHDSISRSSSGNRTSSANEWEYPKIQYSNYVHNGQQTNQKNIQIKHKFE